MLSGYLVILDRVITTPDCSLFHIPNGFMHRHCAHRYVAQYGPWNSLGHLGDTLVLSWYPRQATRRMSPHGHFWVPGPSYQSRTEISNLQKCKSAVFICSWAYLPLKNTASCEIQRYSLFHVINQLLVVTSRTEICGVSHQNIDQEKSDSPIGHSGPDHVARCVSSRDSHRMTGLSGINNTDLHIAACVG